MTLTNDHLSSKLNSIMASCVVINLATTENFHLAEPTYSFRHKNLTYVPQK